MDKVLINKDQKNKIRVINISLIEEDNYFIIKRFSGQYNGKFTTHPEIVISRGKAKRTIEEQAYLEFNSNIKKYIDKGYIILEGKLDDYTEEDLYNLLPEVKTNSTGSIKPMLAKKYKDIKNPKVFDLEYYGSRKINGVRALIYKDLDDGIIKTSSRKAMNYDLAIQHIITNPKLVELFNKYPNLVLDGEIYKFGYPLNYIGKLCRTKKRRLEECNTLQFYWYDIVDLNLEFKDRLQFMLDIKEELSLNFNPKKEFTFSELPIQFVPQIKMSGFNLIMKYHDEYTSEGWEGLVIRNSHSLYKPDSRGNDMIKIKKYIDAEYEITGMSEGLREEDFCFTMITKKGNFFKAKPIGDRTLRQWYRNHINELIGQFGTVKYFELSGVDNDTPQQPQFVCVRNYE